MQATEPAAGMRSVLGMDHSARRGRLLRRGLWGLALLAVLAGVGYWGWRAAAGPVAPRYVTAPATQATLVVHVTATGTLQPITQVDVGSELSGVVRTVTVDFNDHVRAGQVLAKLDTAKQRAQVLQTQAALTSARARVQQAQADVGETRSALARLKSLLPTKIVTEQSVISAEAASKRAAAAEAVTRADVEKATAALNADQIILEKMTIRAPINGIVLRRNVEPGQTVAASLQSPVLFTLADDLARMQLSVAVDEADVGNVHKGQSATFTVDAYPERVFPAKVTEVRYAPQTVAGVVTYEALLAVDNSRLLLRPGMTATATITVATLPDALLVPNAALRFTPPRRTAAKGKNFLVSLFRRRPAPPPEKTAKTVEPRQAGRIVWTLRNGRAAPLRVQVGRTDGSHTQVLEGKVTPGMPLLVDIAGSAK